MHACHTYRAADYGLQQHNDQDQEYMTIDQDWSLV